MATPNFDTGLFGRLRKAAGSEWDGYVNHPFVKALASGTLPEACFRHFLVQDYLFLIQFARAYALAAYKSASIAEIRLAASGMSAILDLEMPLHVSYCRGWGLDEAMMAAQPEAVETMAYSRFVLEAGLAGDRLDLEVALAPCIVGYAEIGQILATHPDTVLDGNPYADWLKSYAGAEYQELAETTMSQLDELGRRRGAEARIAPLARLFTTATRLEAAFWQMGLDAPAG